MLNQNSNLEKKEEKGKKSNLNYRQYQIRRKFRAGNK